MCNTKQNTVLAVLVIALLAGVSAQAQGPKIGVTVGEPLRASSFAFELTAPDGTKRMFGATIPEGITAHDKAVRVAAAVNSTSDWSADVQGSQVTFRHKENGTYKDVPGYTQIYDKTGETTSFDALAAMWGGDFTFGLDPTAMASGYQDDGQTVTSLVTVSTMSGSAVVTPVPGQTTQSIADSLYQQLAGFGLPVEWTSDASFKFSDARSDCFMMCQVTDLNLAVVGAGGLVNVTPEPASLGLLGLGGLAAVRRRRS